MINYGNLYDTIQQSSSISQEEREQMLFGLDDPVDLTNMVINRTPGAESRILRGINNLTSLINDSNIVLQAQGLPLQGPTMGQVVQGPVQPALGEVAPRQLPPIIRAYYTLDEIERMGRNNQ